jgi:glutaredoxin
MFRRLLARLRGRAPLRLTLYTRADCPLCDEMKAELAHFRGGPAFELEEVDIARDPELEARHGLSIPVLAIEGRPAFKGRLSAAELRRKLERRAREIAAGTSPARGGRGESSP